MLKFGVKTKNDSVYIIPEQLFLMPDILYNLSSSHEFIYNKDYCKKTKEWSY